MQNNHTLQTIVISSFPATRHLNEKIIAQYLHSLSSCYNKDADTLSRKTKTFCGVQYKLNKGTNHLHIYNKYTYIFSHNNREQYVQSQSPLPEPLPLHFFLSSTVYYYRGLYLCLCVCGSKHLWYGQHLPSTSFRQVV